MECDSRSCVLEPMIPSALEATPTPGQVLRWNKERRATPSGFPPIRWFRSRSSPCLSLLPNGHPGSLWSPITILPTRPRVGVYPRRVVAKVEWHRGELFPRVGFIVTNLSYPPKGIVRFYNGRGTAEQWIKEGKYALNWTRLSCHKFVANQVRLALFVLAYNLGNFLRRLALPESMKHWSLTSLQTRLIKTGGRLVLHARRLVFQLAEVLVTREMLTGILERISRLRLAPG